MAATTDKIDVNVTRTSAVPDALQDSEKHAANVHTDIGLSYYQRALEIDPSTREAIARRVKRKIDCFLLPGVTV